jgi:hypothetical protein
LVRGKLSAMPQFGTKTLLFVFTLVALWLSTLSGYAAGEDVRRSILLLILVGSGFAALYSRGRRRAFCAGFFVVMLLCGTTDLQRPLSRYLPDFHWLDTAWYSPPATPPMAPTYSPYGAPVILPAPPATSSAQIYSPSYTYSYAAPVSPFSTARRIWIIIISTVWTLLLSVAGGFAAAFIYEQARKMEGGRTS